ncbi:hypothetical protein FRUB_10170 [Fimbriiglobus ruber]|uniref:Uncharacterized protein n=1 Tax=Fimbriiglobus ruber TaxID=1908690 RepID=A0A225DAP1_9BACT|nr:hypothetical protein FRUB_10170 [Fimbriiglobus ruber]
MMNAVTPKGVDHILAVLEEAFGVEVMNAVTPKGVDHISLGFAA